MIVVITTASHRPSRFGVTIEIVEASDAHKLAAGMQGITIRAAKALNKVIAS